MKKTLAMLLPCAALLACALPAAAADTYPAKPVQLVVPFAPGGATDVLTRIVTQRLAQSAGYNLVVENKPGAGGGIAAAFVARAQPDGYTLLVGTTNTHGVNQFLYDKLQYDAQKDFVPVGLIAHNVVVLLAQTGFPASDMTATVAELKAHPGKYTYASPGQGTVHHLAMEMLKEKAGLQVVHAPYRGAGPAMTDLVAGHVPLMMGGIAPAAPFIASGQIKVLGVANSEPFPGLADVQLFGSVAPDLGVRSWIGLFAPRGTPAEIVQKLNADFNAVLGQPELASELADLGLTPQPMTPADFKQMIEDDLPVWQAAVQASGAKE